MCDHMQMKSYQQANQLAKTPHDKHIELVFVDRGSLSASLKTEEFGMHMTKLELKEHVYLMLELGLGTDCLSC